MGGSRIEYEDFALSKVDEVYKRFATGPNGLTRDEATLRLEKNGPNTVPTAKKRGLASRVAEQLKNGFCILLLLAAALSLFTGFVYGDIGSVQTGFALIAVVAINIAFSIFQEYRAEQAVQTIKRLIPTKAKVLRSGVEEQVDVSEVVLGDLVLFDEGDKVPADVRLVSAFEVSVDNSVLTGESEAQRRFVDTTPGLTANTATEYQNLLFAGSTMVSGVARGVVLATGKETQFGGIVALSSEIGESPSPLEKEIERTARLTLILAFIVGAIFFLIARVLVNLTIVANILFAIGVILSFVPWGFQLCISLSLAITAVKMAKRNVVVKRLSAIETMGSTTVLCVDKTGTITSGEMMVERLWASGRVFDVSGDGYSPQGFVTIQGRRVNPEERSHITSLFEVSAFCTNARIVAPTDRIGRWSILGDQTDGAFLVFAGKGDFNSALASVEKPRVGFLPFDTRRRMMTVIHRDGEGWLKAYSKGSSYDVLERCTEVYFDRRVTPLTDEMRDGIREQIDRFAAEGYRVLALASKRLPASIEMESENVEREMTLLGLAALHDPPRPKVEAAVSHAKKGGIKVVMITGDHELTAAAIAKKTGIITGTDYRIVTGPELNKMTDDELAEVTKGEVVFARTSPEHKLRIVKTFMNGGEIVAVTGDGVNDAPALIEADVGISMGGGTDVARESSDMVLLDNDFTSIIEGVRLGRATFDNLRKFAYYIYTHNFAELVTFVAFILLLVPLPLTVMGVLAIEVILEIPIALALIAEPPEEDIMDRPPRARDVRLLDYGILGRATFVGTIEGALPMLYAFVIWSRGGWHLGISTVNDPTLYAIGTTAVLAGIMLGQLGNVLSTRTGSHSILSSNPSRNKWIPAGIVAMLLLLLSIVYVPILQLVFGTAPLALYDWGIMFALALVILLIDEATKLILGAIHRQT
ncbi:MAG: cation-transporting P-type ATPase [Candidatus Bathyarchaeia archaeon]